MLLATLPDPPVFERWLFEQPIPTAIVLGAVGLFVYMALNRQGRGREAVIAGGLCLVLGIAALVTGRLVETTRERLTALSFQLVSAVGAGDSAAVAQLLDEGLTVGSGGKALPLLDRAWLIRAAEAAPSLLDDVVPYSDGAAAEDGAGRTHMIVRARLRQLGTPTSSLWEFRWRRTGDRWRVVAIECLNINGREPGTLWAEAASRMAR
ncbi:MAG: nuclear transport factor 2 family protein [Phycisphaerales bacterium]|nr:nuclear transport factor 2 family protein [Phycisphaerales bacterium]